MAARDEHPDGLGDHGIRLARGPGRRVRRLDAQAARRPRVTGKLRVYAGLVTGRWHSGSVFQVSIGSWLLLMMSIMVEISGDRNWEGFLWNTTSDTHQSFLATAFV